MEFRGREGVFRQLEDYLIANKDARIHSFHSFVANGALHYQIIVKKP